MFNVVEQILWKWHSEPCSNMWVCIQKINSAFSFLLNILGAIMQKASNPVNWGQVTKYNAKFMMFWVDNGIERLG